MVNIVIYKQLFSFQGSTRRG